MLSGPLGLPGALIGSARYGDEIPIFRPIFPFLFTMNVLVKPPCRKKNLKNKTARASSVPSVQG